MRALNGFAMVVGYVVSTMWLFGSLGLGDFTLHFKLVKRLDGKTYNCHDGAGLARRKYECDFAEFARREAEGVNEP